MSTRAYKQMTYDDRVYIENQLNTPDVTLKMITNILGRDGNTMAGRSNQNSRADT